MKRVILSTDILNGNDSFTLVVDFSSYIEDTDNVNEFVERGLDVLNSLGFGSAVIDGDLETMYNDPEVTDYRICYSNIDIPDNLVDARLKMISSKFKKLGNELNINYKGSSMHDINGYQVASDF